MSPQSLPVTNLISIVVPNFPIFVIEAANKGGALVVWRTDLYQKEALRQLSDTSIYQKVDKDLTSINQKTIKKTNS